MRLTFTVRDVIHDPHASRIPALSVVTPPAELPLVTSKAHPKVMPSATRKAHRCVGRTHSGFL